MKRTIFLIAACLATLFAAAQTFIDPELSAEMNQRGETEKIKVSIIMLEQSNPTALQREANFIPTRRQRRDFVVETLKQQAARSQADLLAVLSEMEQNGMVSNVRSLWLSNAVTCEASPEAVRDLSQRHDLQSISLDKEYQCLIDNAPDRQAEATREITPNLLQVQADKVWEMGYNGEGVLVGLVDSGFNYNHDDLQGRLWDGGDEFPHHGYDFYSNDNDPMDEAGHGTHCAGIICGTGASGTQTGVAPGVTLMCVKATDGIGFGSVSQFCAGLQFVLEHGVDLISFSVGFPQLSAAERTQFRQLCDNILAANVITAVAAGNYYEYQDMFPVPDNVCTPGSCPPPMLQEVQLANSGGTSCVVCVGAVDADDQLASFSSIGPVRWDNVPAYGDYPYTPGDDERFGLIRPDVCAPGVNIKSLSLQNNSGYGFRDGTSFATPCVAGVIALMLQANPELTPAEIDDILETTAVHLSPTKDNLYGSGRIDALAAVEMALGDTIISGCTPVNNLTHSVNDNMLLLTWETPTNPEGLIEYQIVANDTLTIGTTTDLSYQTEMPDGKFDICVTAVYPGCSKSACVSVEILSVDERERAVNVYPNPSTGIFTVVCEGMTEATVFSADGKLVKRIAANGQCHIEGLSNGVYLLKINTKSGILVRRIVKI
ncbi:MAG: S8 family peptidase [Bacteroidales bacterium]|nr:S8 family peptidase [Bacteroidales bacterium]